MTKPEPNLFGDDIFGAPIKPDSRGAVADNFLAAPFTVLDARQGWWQTRKRQWVAMGIDSGDGRGEALTWREGDDYLGQVLGEMGATSIFDPVLCELAYRWFCPEGGQVIDPFAGGSVRGLVAHNLGLQYWGCDLRQEQIDANNKQGEIVDPFNVPTWVCCDALVAEPPEADLIQGCPPYGDLEVYSELEADISNMEYADFLVAYKAIIKRFCAKLKNNRFAFWVVGEFRNPKNGIYRNFVSDTILAFQLAGLDYYNEAILVTMVGTASARVTKQFRATRKFCRTHQTVLVFIKGDPKKAADACAKL